MRHLWSRDATSSNVYRHMQTEEKRWTREAIQELTALSQFQDLAHASQENPVVSDHVERLVGTPLGASHCTLLTLALSTLPTPGEIESGSFDDFEARWQRLADFLTTQQLKYKTLHLLHGLTISGQEEIELEPGLTIDRLTNRDIEQAMGLGLIKPALPSSYPLSILSESQLYAIKSSIQLPKVTSPPDGSADGDPKAVEAAFRQLAQGNEAAERVFHCMSLLTGDRIGLAGTMTTADSWLPLGSGVHFTSSPTPSSIPPKWPVDCSEAERLKDIWSRLKRPENKAILLPIRRLSFASQRKLDQDRMLDLFIAAESFYLTEIGSKDKGELKYRLAIRAAAWFDKEITEWTKRDVFKHMKTGYDLRSTIAHGGECRPKDIKIGEEQTSLSEFASTTEQILRAALIKAINRSDGPIHWDDLVIPE